MNLQHLKVSAVEFWTNKLDGALAPIARFALGNILCVPPSTACVERLFSMASLVQHTNRLRLSGYMTENELLLRLNHDYVDV
jgi:hAT family protein